MQFNTKHFFPFQKVLVRDFPTSEWIPAFYCRKEPALGRHEVMSHHVSYNDPDIIPYQGNEYLTGTTIDPD